MRWKLAPHVAWQTIDGEVVVVDVRNGASLGLNATGSTVWCDLGVSTVEEIASRIAVEFQLSQDAALRDVQSLIDELRKRELIVEVK